ncbi:MAG: PIG-L family deacetylase [Candidatus Thermofonsia Clade 1 bacterium]|jgi:LmbE family N-acetylglucosaminyl deacetylase|uniref:PIG-L family deacetylase n=1 Tax=Candidatus Thermofonsia Clade 1 bacterium TaxID=2364210 RepID=A0A2M8PH92_9CHLR|nr:MAG: PIG-L family deacetylase [Candidatus Thermofonsia Clade 1 bacterium]RMF51310.1 MAG: PIG-L family deacetylase [Chloroflexota bacterium]
MADANAPLQRVMAIYAHPDDPEFFSGGLLAKWAAEGKRLFYVLATSGDKGSDDPEMTSERLSAIREAEQRAAAACFGAEQVIFLRYPDGELEHTLRLRRDLTRLIRQLQPDIVVTTDPHAVWTRTGGINHPDHRAIGEAALAAVYPSARDRLTFIELWRDEGLAPHKVRQVYLAGTLDPNRKVDITAYLERKIEAISQHRSQVKDFEALRKRLRESRDADFDDDTPLYTESYRVLTLR